MNRKKRRDRETAGKILIITGSFIILFVITFNLIDLLKSAIAINEFKKYQNLVVVEKIDDNGKVISQGESGEMTKESSPADESNEVTGEEQNEAYVEATFEENAYKPDLKETICLLRIPKIKLEEAVKEGSTKGVLSSALGHFENTALPGKEGNCCIAGHRNYVFGKYFNRLNEVTVGDVIELVTNDNIYQYEVVSTEVVEPEEVRVLNYAEGKNLTLITCTPFMVGTHRLIVHAVILGDGV